MISGEGERAMVAVEGTGRGGLSGFVRSGCLWALALTLCGPGCTDEPARLVPRVADLAVPQAPSCGPEAGCCGHVGAPCPTGLQCRSIASQRDASWCEDPLTAEVYVPPGVFWMGCNPATDAEMCEPDESPQHKVYLRGFFIDRLEVSAAQYAACVDASACGAPAKLGGVYQNWQQRPSHPINEVSWAQARDYCAWSGKPAGAQTLCSEARWEKAARGGCAAHGCGEDDDACCRAAMPRYPWGNDEATCENGVMTDGARHCGKDGTQSVGSKPLGMSPYGALDLAGNVWEWGQDWYGAGWYAAFEDDLQVDPQGPSASGQRISRGGGFDHDARARRAANRAGTPPEAGYGSLGLRCCRGAD